MSGRVFVDTTALVSYFDGRDTYHIDTKNMIAVIGQNRVKLILTDYILDEAITTIKAKMGHDISVKAGEFILQTQAIELIWLDQELKLRAWEYFKRHEDKSYSFTDCTSFVLMKEMRISHYLSLDKHFEQAGFRLFS